MLVVALILLAVFSVAFIIFGILVDKKFLSGAVLTIILGFFICFIIGASGGNKYYYGSFKTKHLNGMVYGDTYEVKVSRLTSISLWPSTGLCLYHVILDSGDIFSVSAEFPPDIVWIPTTRKELVEKKLWVE